VIIGTAGHIDHGKTTLVRALTGVDTDRLPEEKQRGISIELGYAYMDDGRGGRIGFVDVPGHERLVHTMLAGATGIDHVLLLVAADDGVMPQTREHLAIVTLLKHARGTVVITKIDRAQSDWSLHALETEIREMLAPTPLAGSPMFRVAAPDGVGIDALRQHLQAIAAAGAKREERALAGFRLAIDRVFTLDGHGTIVAGPIHAGQVAVGQMLSLAPDSGIDVRVRSLRVNGESAALAHAGARAALGIGGQERAVFRRGCWLVDPGLHVSTYRLDVELERLPGIPPLKSGTHVHAHLGTVSVMGTLTQLDDDERDPERLTQTVQIVMRAPVAAWRGDRIVLRDASATKTVAGGVVVDPFAPSRYRRSPARMAELAAMRLPNAMQRLEATTRAMPNGLDWGRWQIAEGSLAESPCKDATESDGKVPFCVRGTRTATWLLADEFLEPLLERILAGLADFHARHPDESGPDSARLRRIVAPRMAEVLFASLIEDQITSGAIHRLGASLALPTHLVQLSQAEARIAQKVAPPLEDTRFEGRWVRDLARDIAEPEPILRVTLNRLAKRGSHHQIVKDLFYTDGEMARLAAIAREVAHTHAGVVVASQFRDATGLGRKRAIQILEYFDRMGLLRRVGDLHKLRADCQWFARDAESAKPLVLAAGR
jgi:selenocysteine-specific elongation factor